MVAQARRPGTRAGRFSADSIMGVTFFADDAPEEFGKFDRAFITMYRLTAGDTWVRSLVRMARRYARYRAWNLSCRVCWCDVCYERWCACVSCVGVCERV